MVRGYLVNEFGEKVGDYNIRSVGKYHVSLFHQNKGIQPGRVFPSDIWKMQKRE